jgi:hypothetical protein
MTDMTMQSTERDPRTLLGDFLRPRAGSAKELARLIGCDPRSAEGYRAGRYWPQAKHWVGIVRAFGEDVTEAVFHPQKARERLEREVRELEAELEARRVALRHAGQSGASGSEGSAGQKQGSAPVEARSFAPDRDTRP